MRQGSRVGSDDPTVWRGADSRPSRDLVAVVVVTYHPSPGLVDRAAPLLSQAGAVLVVDNGSTDEELGPIQAVVGGIVTELIRNGKNLGIATALNTGIEWVERRGIPWVLTLDQDTIVGPDVVSEAGRVFDALPTPPPAVISAGWEAGWSVADPGGPIVCAITSGALHSVAAWRSLGGFREDFFIDYVDTEFSLRARARGYQVLGVRRPTIQHKIGHPTQHKTALRSFSVTNHDRVRRYYITRNRIHVWRQYWRVEPRFVASDIKAAVKEFPKMILFETDRRRKVAAVIRGLIDGFRGITGRSEFAHR